MIHSINCSYNKLLLFSLSLLLLFACKKDSVNSGSPVISRVRAISPAPNDSVLTTALPGDFVVIQGENLKGAFEISFNGFTSMFNAGLFSENNLVVPVPDIVWDSIPDGKLNVLEVTTPGGTATFTFNITAPTPSIAAISNENAVEGSVITITGTNFYGVTKITFPGNKEVTNFTANGTTGLTLTVPAGVTTGPVSVTGIYGSGTSTIVFNNHLAPTVGFLANFEDGDPFFGWQWWGGNKTNAGHARNTGNYIQMNPSSIGGNNGGWYADNRAVMVAGSAWLPNANLGEPISNYAMKFELSVKLPWKNGAFMIVPNGNFNYMARYAPWENAPGGSFETNGNWVTVVIPLNRFLSGTGDYNPNGAPASNIAALTGGTNAASMQIMLYNDGAAAMPAFDAAVDNVRIVKVN